MGNRLMLYPNVLHRPPACPRHIPVAYSCKGRGVCPSFRHRAGIANGTTGCWHLMRRCAWQLPRWQAAEPQEAAIHWSGARWLLWVEPGL
jgi:hypothetical protein